MKNIGGYDNAYKSIRRNGGRCGESAENTPPVVGVKIFHHSAKKYTPEWWFF